MTSENEVFITLDDPAGATDYRTVLYLATKGSLATTESACITDTWANFSGPANVHAWDETSKLYLRDLHYYQDSTGHGNTTTAELLDEQDGTCNAWADFLNECFLANNISGSAIATADEPGTWWGLGVKNIGFGTPTYDPGIWGRFCYVTGDLDTGVTGLAGQNMDTPAAKLFNYHRMVYVGGTYYDPAYGKTIADNSTAKKAYTDASVDAWNDVQYRYPPGYDIPVWSEVEVGDPALDFSH